MLSYFFNVTRLEPDPRFRHSLPLNLSANVSAVIDGLTAAKSVLWLGLGGISPPFGVLGPRPRRAAPGTSTGHRGAARREMTLRIRLVVFHPPFLSRPALKNRAEATQSGAALHTRLVGPIQMPPSSIRTPTATSPTRTPSNHIPRTYIPRMMRV